MVLNYGPLAVNEIVKIYGSTMVEIKHTGASGAVVYVAAGSRPVLAELTEITNIYDYPFTRTTLSGDGFFRVALSNSLTEGTHIAVILESGTATSIEITVLTSR